MLPNKRIETVLDNQKLLIEKQLSGLLSDIELLIVSTHNRIIGELRMYNFPVLPEDGIFEGGVITLQPRPHFSLWVDLSDWVIDSYGWLANQISGIGDVLDSIQSWISLYMSDISDSIYSTITGWVNDLYEWVIDYIEPLYDWISDIYDDIKSWVDDKLKDVYSWVNDWADYLQSVIQDAYNWLDYRISLVSEW